MTEDERRERFEALYREHFRAMYLAARRALPNGELAEDAVQSAFLVAWRKPEALFESPSPAGWLFKTLRNTVGDTLRALARLRALTAEGAEADAAVLDERDVLLEYESAENRAELRLLVRAFCFGESYADIAAELGISVAAVKKRIQRAKERLRAQLEAESHL